MANQTNYDPTVYEFQKWLIDNYPDEAKKLGKYGKLKDGADGEMGTNTKPLWDKYGEDFATYHRALTPISSLPASNISPTLNANPLAGLSKTIPTDDLLASLQAKNDAATMGQQLAEAKQLKTQGILDILPTALGGAYGIGQMIKGRNLSKNLKPPKRVAPLLPNQQLSTLLAQTGVNANMADPKIREQALRDITTNREMANEAARVGSAGDVTSFSQNAQKNYLQSNDAIRKLASDETGDIYKNRLLYANLIGQKMNEDRANHNEKIDEFNNIDYPEFKAARSYAAQ